jgi:hypothetical protein
LLSSFNLTITRTGRCWVFTKVCTAAQGLLHAQNWNLQAKVKIKIVYVLSCIRTWSIQLR